MDVITKPDPAEHSSGEDPPPRERVGLGARHAQREGGVCPTCFSVLSLTGVCAYCG